MQWFPTGFWKDKQWIEDPVVTLMTGPFESPLSPLNLRPTPPGSYHLASSSDFTSSPQKALPARPNALTFCSHFPRFEE